MEKEKNKNSNAGLICLLVCGVIAVGLIVACVFFPDEVFGIFLK